MHGNPLQKIKFFTPHIIGAILTLIIFLPLYSLRILTSSQLTSYIFLGGGHPTSSLYKHLIKTRPNIVIYTLSVLLPMDYYTLIHITALTLIPILTTLYIRRKNFNIEIIPLFAYSLLAGDPLTPVLYLISRLLTNPVVKSLLEMGLVIINPEYGVILAFKKGKSYVNKVWLMLFGIVGILLSLNEFGLYFLYNYNQIFIVILFLGTLTIKIAKIVLESKERLSIYKLLLLAFSIVNPQVLYLPSEEKENPQVEILLNSFLQGLVIFILLLSIISTATLSITSKSTAIERNPGVDRFVTTYIPNGATVLTINLDRSIDAILKRHAVTISPRNLDYEWNWSNYAEVRSNFELIIDMSRHKQIKYIILEKRVGIVPYWPPTNEFSTYKYYLDPLQGKELIIMKNNFVPSNLSVYVIEDIQKTNSITNLIYQYQRYWTNSTETNLIVRENGITIRSTNPYQVYIWFLNPLYNSPLEEGASLVIKMVNTRQGENRRLNNIQIYLSNQEKLHEPYLTLSNVDAKGLYIINLDKENNLSQYTYIVLKIDGNISISIEKILVFPTKLSQMVSSTITNDGITLVNKFKNAQIKLVKVVSYLPSLPDTFVLEPLTTENIPLTPTFATLMYSIYILAGFIGCLYIKLREGRGLKGSSSREFMYNNSHPMNGSTLYFSVILLIPVLYYVLHNPESLGVGWIGSGGFIYYFLMTIPILTIYIPTLSKLDRQNLLFNYLTFTSLALTASLIIKNFIINTVLIDRLYTYWHISSAHSSVDYLSFGVFYLLASTMSVKKRILGALSISSIYLIVYGTLGMIDITRLLPSLYLSKVLEINLFISTLFLSSWGYVTRSAYSTYGLNVEILQNNKRVYEVIIGWPCSGITGLFLYLVFITTTYTILKYRIGKSDSAKPIIFITLGAIGAILLNGFRIAAIIYLAINYSVNASEIFHSSIYDVVYWIYVVTMIGLLKRIHNVI